MSKLRIWISTARLRTLPLSISGIVTAAAAAMQVDNYSVTIFVLALLTTLGFQILSNFSNDYGDGIKGTDNEQRVGPARALQSGLLTAKELKRGMVITAVVTLFIASILIFEAFGMDNILLSFLFFNLGIAALIAAVKYTVGNSAYGYKALGDVFVFIFFGIVGVIGCYFLFTQSLGDWIVLPAITIGLLSTAVLNLNNMRDRKSDAIADKNTLAVLLGEKWVKLYHAFLISGAFISALCYFCFRAESLLDYIPLIAFLPLFINIIKVYSTIDPKKLDPELKKVALSTFLFSILFLVSNFF